MGDGPVLGIDVGGTKCLGLVLEGGPDGACTVRGERKVPTPPGERLVEGLVGLVRSLEEEAGARATAIGVGLPGLVDRSGRLRYAPNLAGVPDEAAAELRDRTGRPVRVENDATCATWGEYRQGAGRGHDDVLLVTLGTGIGGGLVTGGRLATGAHGFAGEVGHMVVDPGGAPCACGHRGCWERYASGSGLARLAGAAAREGRLARVLELAGGDPDAIEAEQVVEAAAGGDPQAAAVLDELAHWLGMGLANLAAVLDPAVVVVGGGLSEAGSPVLDRAREAFAGALMGGGSRPAIPLVPAELGPRAGAVGAALLGRDGGSPGAGPASGGV